MPYRVQHFTRHPLLLGEADQIALIHACQQIVIGWLKRERCRSIDGLRGGRQWLFRKLQLEGLRKSHHRKNQETAKGRERLWPLRSGRGCIAAIVERHDFGAILLGATADPIRNAH